MKTVQIAVIGEVNRGKTALVNALLNRSGFLPESPLPNTTEVTLVGGLPIDPTLNRQVNLWDTPGLGAALPISERRKRKEFIAIVLRQSHAAIGVFLADPPPDDILFDMVRETLPYTQRWLFVLNDKGDRFQDEPEGLIAIMGFVENRLRMIGIETPIVVRANVHTSEGIAEFWLQFEELIGDLLRDSRALHEANAHKVKAQVAARAIRQSKADAVGKTFV